MDTGSIGFLLQKWFWTLLFVLVLYWLCGSGHRKDKT
jgi:hypothetical protein